MYPNNRTKVIEQKPNCRQTTTISIQPQNFSGPIKTITIGQEMDFILTGKPV